MSEAETRVDGRQQARQGLSYVEPAWLSQVEIRLVAQPDLLALEWDGEYTHFRRLYREVYQNACKGEALMWVADFSGVAIIGQVFVSLRGARSELADGVTRAYIYGFRVRPQFRGFGLGTRLLHTVENDLAQRRFSWVTLNVGRQNRDALRFYERRGYKIIAPEPGRWSYLDDQGRRRDVHEPAWRMHKSIA
ncbi:MAG: GNAT family N-acetyltransferase [Anaerolineales bacterium]|nr:GNAT family N-acetyltransferase [Anaerolineales bacterium]